MREIGAEVSWHTTQDMKKQLTCIIALTPLLFRAIIPLRR
jgi:hypothetical protein